jgi:hypothetical protein
LIRESKAKRLAEIQRADAETARQQAQAVIAFLKG